jgi:hypothetical protein
VDASVPRRESRVDGPAPRLQSRHPRVSDRPDVIALRERLQVPKLQLVENVAFLTMPGRVGRLSTSWLSGAIYGVMGRLPFYRNLIRHLRYEFSGERAKARSAVLTLDGAG